MSYLHLERPTTKTGQTYWGLKIIQQKHSMNWKKKLMKNIIDIPHLQDPTILLVIGSAYQSSLPSDHLSVPEGRPKKITKVFVR